MGHLRGSALAVLDFSEANPLPQKQFFLAAEKTIQSIACSQRLAEIA
jgi:hypothetical protein